MTREYNETAEYLGDGVYVEIENEMLKLSTERLDGESLIYLEPEVYQALRNYALKHFGF